MKLLVLFISLLTTAAFADPAKPEPKAVTLPAGIRMERDLAYIPDGDEAQKLDLYLPESAPEHPRPLIVHIHGGGWQGGSKFPSPFIELVQKGYVVASVEYRFSQKAKFPAQIQDCQAAIRWLRANHEKYCIDPGKIGVVGGSAGGHLSALVGTSGGAKIFPAIGGHDDLSDRVQAVCDIYGPADFTTVVAQAAADTKVRNIFQFDLLKDPYSRLIGGTLEDQAKSQAVSPVTYISEDDPPILILHGTHDALVPYAQSVQFAGALKAKGVPVWLQTLPGSGHGGPAFGKPAVRQLMHSFFEKFLKGVDAEITLVPEADLAVDAPK